MDRELKFLGICREVALLSKDSVKVGAVIMTHDLNILSAGYNGPPRGVIDSPERFEKPLKAYFSAHAEENAIAQAARNGVKLAGSTILITGRPACATCTRLIIQAGIKRVIHPRLKAAKLAESKWHDDWAYSRTMFFEANIEVIEYDPNHNTHQTDVCRFNYAQDRSAWGPEL